MNKMQLQDPVWIDCDAGADDALGLLLAAQANIVGIGSVRGNAAVQQVSQNILRVLTLCSRLDVPVYPGADKSSNGEQHSIPKWSGKDGLGDRPEVSPSSENITAKPASGTAWDMLCQAAGKYSGSLSVIATGPLTNLALALEQDAELPAKVKRLVVMGGNEARNEYTSTGAEFNFYCDPDAASVVISKFSGKTVLLTWESIERNPVDGKFMQHWTQKDTRRAHFTNAILGLKKYQTSAEPWAPCDPLAFAAALHEPLVLKSEDVLCSVETADQKKRGQTSFLSQDAAHDVGKAGTAGGVVCKVNAVNVDQFAELLDQATEVE